MTTSQPSNEIGALPKTQLVDGMEPIERVESQTPTAASQPLRAATHELDGSPELQFRTIAVRVDEQLHAQLSFLAQLAGNSISDEVRTAINGRITSAQDDPALIARAEQVRDQIEREATARSAAIAGFMGHKAVEATSDSSKSPAVAPSTPRSSSSSGSRQQGRRSQNKEQQR